MFGFGTLVTIDLTVRPAPEEPRLFSSWSVMLGYSVFLPIALSGWHLFRAQFPLARPGWIVGVLVGLLAAAAMVYCQMVWLVDPSPRPTWILTTPHSFNVLGWYNTLFTVGAFGSGGFLVGDALTRVNSESGMRRMPKGRRQAARRGILLALVGLAGFAGAVLLDNVGYLQHASSQATVINTALVIGITILVLGLMRPDSRSLHEESGPRKSGISPIPPGPPRD